MCAHNQLRIGVRGIQFEDALVIVTGSYGVAERRKPGAFHQSGVNRELRSRDPAAIERVDVVRIVFELLLLESQSALDQVLDLILDRKSTRLNSSHLGISYAVFCLKKKIKKKKNELFVD